MIKSLFWVLLRRAHILSGTIIPLPLEYKQNLEFPLYFAKFPHWSSTFLLKIKIDNITKQWPSLYSIADVVERFCNHARQQTTKWILIIPLIHLLKGESEPFQPVPPVFDPQCDPLRALRQTRGSSTSDSGAKYDIFIA